MTDLAAETRAASEAVERAQEARDDAIRSVMILEANTIAAEAERLAEASLSLRVRLAAIFSPVDRTPGISEATKRAVVANGELITNTPEWGLAKASEITWSAFAVALRSDAEERPCWDL